MEQPIQPQKPVILSKRQGHYKQLGLTTQDVDTLSDKGSKTKTPSWQELQKSLENNPSLNQDSSSQEKNFKKLNFDEEEPFITKKLRLNDQDRKNSSCFSATTNDTSQNPFFSPQSMNIEADEKEFDSNEFFLDGFDEDSEQIDRQKTMEQINSIINKNNASIGYSQNIVSDDSTFSCTCFLRHTWETSLRQLEAGDWCETCQQLLKKAKMFAESNKGVILNTVYSPELEFVCKKEHQWSLSHKNYFKSKWCSSCRKMMKEEFKQFIKDNEAKKQKEYEQKQYEMYNEARRKSQSAHQEEFESPKGDQNFSQVCEELTKKASEMAQQYLIKNNDAQFNQIKEVYKIILLPDGVLSMYFNQLSQEQLKNEYRTTAKLIHPDKCLHPQAGQAFQKLNHFHAIAVKRWVKP